MALVLRTVEKDGVTYAEVRNGKPVYLDDQKNNQEVEFDADGAFQQIGRLNGEAKNLRTQKEAAEAAATPFAGLDAEKAKAALATVQGLDDKKLIDAGEAQKVRDAAVAATEAKFKPIQEENQALKGQLQGALISGGIASSSFVKDKMTIPADMVEAVFGKHFSIQDGKPIAKDASGNPIFSTQKPGEYASIDEALPALVNAYPNKDSILKGANHRGSGADHDMGGAGTTMTRAEFNKLPDAQKMDIATKGEVKLVD